MGERGERGPGKDEGAFRKMTLPTIPWPEVLPGTQPHRRPKPGLPGASCCCPVLSLLGSDETPQKACPADTCPDGPGDRERGAPQGFWNHCFYGRYSLRNPRGDPCGPQPVFTWHTPYYLSSVFSPLDPRTLSGLRLRDGEISSVQPKGQSL